MTVSLAKALQIFIPFALGYFLSYLYRVVNAVIAPHLVADLGIGPSDLGMLTSAYFITFAAFQMPLGVLLDRFGPRKVESALLLFAGLGALIFARSTSLAGIVAGRALIGFGVSACLMAAFKAYVLWFPKEAWPRINGFQMAAGGLGALAATAPVEAALHVTDWRGVFLALAGLTFLVAVLIFLVIPEDDGQKSAESLKEQVRGIRQVISSHQFWRTAPLTAVSHASFLAIQSLWAGPWLKDVAQMDRGSLALVLLCIAAAMVVGFALFGALAEWLGKNGVSVLATAVALMAAFMVPQVLIILELTAWTTVIWVLFGFLGTSGIVAYAALALAFPAQLSGRVTTSVNLLVFVGAFAGQWGIGAIINLWPVGPGGVYAPQGYQAGFAVVLGLQVLALGWFFAAGLVRKAKRPRAGKP